MRFHFYNGENNDSNTQRLEGACLPNGTLMHRDESSVTTEDTFVASLERLLSESEDFVLFAHISKLSRLKWPSEGAYERSHRSVLVLFSNGGIAAGDKLQLIEQGLRRLGVTYVWRIAPTYWKAVDMPEWKEMIQRLSEWKLDAAKTILDQINGEPVKVATEAPLVTDNDNATSPNAVNCRGDVELDPERLLETLCILSCAQEDAVPPKLGGMARKKSWWNTALYPMDLIEVEKVVRETLANKGVKANRIDLVSSLLKDICNQETSELSRESILAALGVLREHLSGNVTDAVRHA